MTSSYRPHTDEIRSVWAAFSEYGGLVIRQHPTLWSDRLAEFDAWLSDRDSRVSEDEKRSG